VLSAGEAERLLHEAERRPREAEETLSQARALREAIYDIFSAEAAGARPHDNDLAALNTALVGALAHARLVSTEHGIEWGWEPLPDALDRMLWPVARSAADLLTSDDLERVTECASDSCGWLFMDMSRNHSRRWCDMSDCGNRAKAKRHYERKRAAAS
jgi:predicted RNA-binding Zn ribbon-like protein